MCVLYSYFHLLEQKWSSVFSESRHSPACIENEVEHTDTAGDMRFWPVFFVQNAKFFR